VEFIYESEAMYSFLTRNICKKKTSEIQALKRKLGNQVSTKIMLPKSTNCN